MSPIRPQPRIVDKNETSVIDDLYSMASGLPGRVALPKPRLKEIFYTIQPWESSFVSIATSPNGICLMDIEGLSDAILRILSTSVCVVLSYYINNLNPAPDVTSVLICSSMSRSFQIRINPRSRNRQRRAAVAALVNGSVPSLK